jgi:hypothetical protein
VQCVRLSQCTGTISASGKCDGIVDVHGEVEGPASVPRRQIAKSSTTPAAKRRAHLGHAIPPDSVAGNVDGPKSFVGEGEDEPHHVSKKPLPVHCQTNEARSQGRSIAMTIA